jgi:hypothetical protein
MARFQRIRTPVFVNEEFTIHRIAEANQEKTIVLKVF